MQPKVSEWNCWQWDSDTDRSCLHRHCYNIMWSRVWATRIQYSHLQLIPAVVRLHSHMPRYSSQLQSYYEKNFYQCNNYSYNLCDLINFRLTSCLRMRCKFHTYLPLRKFKHYCDQSVPKLCSFHDMSLFPDTAQSAPLMIALHVILAPHSLYLYFQ